MYIHSMKKHNIVLGEMFSVAFLHLHFRHWTETFPEHTIMYHRLSFFVLFFTMTQAAIIQNIVKRVFKLSLKSLKKLNELMSHFTLVSPVWLASLYYAMWQLSMLTIIIVIFSVDICHIQLSQIQVHWKILLKFWEREIPHTALPQKYFKILLGYPKEGPGVLPVNCDAK